MIRIRLVKTVATPLGVAEITLLDVPLDQRKWTKRDDQALERLEDYVAHRAPS